MTDPIPLDELYRYLPTPLFLVRWFEVAPDVWSAWSRDRSFDPDVVALMHLRNAGAPPALSADVHVRRDFPPGQWIAYARDGEELGRGGPT